MGGIDLLYKITYSATITFVMLAIAAIAIQVAENNNFVVYSNNIVERHGGLTTEAIQEIHEYSSEQFNDRFEILTSTEKMPYGTVISYEYEMKLTPVFLNFEIGSLTLNSTATSKVR